MRTADLLRLLLCELGLLRGLPLLPLLLGGLSLLWAALSRRPRNKGLPAGLAAGPQVPGASVHRHPLVRRRWPLDKSLVGATPGPMEGWSELRAVEDLYPHREASSGLTIAQDAKGIWRFTEPESYRRRKEWVDRDMPCILRLNDDDDWLRIEVYPLADYPVLRPEHGTAERFVHGNPVHLTILLRAQFQNPTPQILRDVGRIRRYFKNQTYRTKVHSRRISGFTPFGGHVMTVAAGFPFKTRDEDVSDCIRRCRNPHHGDTFTLSF